MHNVNRKHVSPAAIRVVERLRAANYEGYIVGGAVRDLILGGKPGKLSCVVLKLNEICKNNQN